MSPERSPKRQKVEDNKEPASETRESNSEPLLTPDTAVPETTATPTSPPQQSSWYASWSRKALPITQLARESIKASSSSIASEDMPIEPTSPKPKTLRSSSLATAIGKKQSNRALPADVATTVVHATSQQSNTLRKKSKDKVTVGEEPAQDAMSNTTVGLSHQTKDDLPTHTKATSTKQPEMAPWPDPALDKADKTSPPADTIQNAPVPARSSWLGWLGGGEAAQSTLTADEPPQSSDHPTAQKPPPPEVAQESLPQTPKSEPHADTLRNSKVARRSWLPWVGGASDAQSEVSADQLKPDDAAHEAIDSSVPVKPSESGSSEISAPPDLPHNESKPAAWAFWSRDRNATDSSSSNEPVHKGEIAISDTSSQNKPRRASISLKETDRPNIGDKPVETKAKDADQKKPKEVKPKQQKSETTPSKVDGTNASAVSRAPTEDKKPASIRSARLYQNLLLPEFRSTLKLPENPSIVQQLARLLHITKEPELQHLSLIKDPPRIKNALAIGVHGFFPAPLLRTVLGQPTGTSIKFADMAAKSIKRWTAAHGYECQVKTAALEGEGKIAERIDLLWKLLINWVDEITRSDFLLIACHSQGVPVAIMLVAKLIQFGCVNAARVGICAMAGVNMGPFPEFKSRWISGSAGELFEFSDPSGRVSVDYMAALEVVLKFGVRLTFIGSIDDQLVSLESSIFSPISHPHIYRAVSIDAKVHSPNFLSHLVGFALKLRNLGVHDHGLIRELSSPLAGSLYTGEGHSRIYEDDAVYDLAVAFALETNAMVDVPMVRSSVLTGGANPYILPFAMRGILEEDFVKNQLQDEASVLLKQFDEWKPTTKVLKDVKFRLEGIRSKL